MSDVIRYALAKHKVIPAVMTLDDVEEAVKAPCGMVFIINANISTLESTCQRIHDAGKIALVHVDLMGGLKRDEFSIQYLAEHVNVDGIVTTHANFIPVARRYNVLTVLRVFVMDSASLQHLTKSTRESKPSAVEILPGVVLPNITQRLNLPNQLIIAGGLINTEAEITNILAHGAQGVSTSHRSLWHTSLTTSDS